MMMQPGSAPDDPGSAPAINAARAAIPEQRIATLVRGEFAFVWRALRRFGLEPADADDAAQQVFMIIAEKIGQVESGSERSFLFGTAVRIASRSRRSERRRREVDPSALAEHADPTSDLDALLEQRRARALLDDLLDSLPDDLRAAFVLFEIEQLKMVEIAELLALPLGTVASRLRRAREAFQVSLARLRAGSGASETISETRDLGGVDMTVPRIGGWR